MLWIINLLQKRPSDKNIRIWKVVFGLIFSLSLFYNLIYLWKDIDNEYLFWLITIDENTKLILKYIVSSLWIIPIISGVFNVCFLKTKYARIAQIVGWIWMFYISSSIVSSPNLDIDFLIWFLWIVPIIAWITWKCITTKCLKYKEKITKIRV